MKKSLIYTIEREFLGSVSITTFLVRMVKKHLQSEMERGEISCEKAVEKNN